MNKILKLTAILLLAMPFLGFAAQQEPNEAHPSKENIAKEIVSMGIFPRGLEIIVGSYAANPVKKFIFLNLRVCKIADFPIENLEKYRKKFPEFTQWLTQQDMMMIPITYTDIAACKMPTNDYDFWNVKDLCSCSNKKTDPENLMPRYLPAPLCKDLMENDTLYITAGEVPYALTCNQLHHMWLNDEGVLPFEKQFSMITNGAFNQKKADANNDNE